MIEIKVYNVVTYDSVDAYVIKAIGRNENDIKAQFKNYSDMEILKIDYLYNWDDLNEHIKCVLAGECSMADGNEPLAKAIYRYIELTSGLELE